MDWCDASAITKAFLRSWHDRPDLFEIVESLLALDRLASASQEVHFDEYSTLKCNQMIYANLGFLTLCAGLSPLVCPSPLLRYPSRQPR